MNKPHKHAELIKAWADGAEIQYMSNESGAWNDIDHPGWSPEFQYRIKPREFIDGRWYPLEICEVKRVIALYVHSRFYSSNANDSGWWEESRITWIGEPLPEIEWPEI